MTEQPLPLTQEQDHDRRLSQLEGTAEQFVAQSRQTNTRLDHIDQTIAAQGRELRREIAVLTRWLVGMQAASLVALGTLILLRLP